jgi:hypothetical protein
MGASYLHRELLYKKIIFYVAFIIAVLVFSTSSLTHESQSYIVIAESNYNDFYNKDQPRILPFNSKLGISPQAVQSNTSCEKLPIRSVTANGNDGNVPLNIIDRNLNTRWSNDDQGSWIQLDLGSKKDICGIDIAWYRGNVRQNNLVISVSNDGNMFTDLFQGTSTGTTTSPEKYNAIPLGSSGRYLRVTVNGNTENDWASMTEIAVFGTTGSGSLFHQLQTALGTSTWSQWTSLGGGLRDGSNPAVIANSNGRLEVFVVGNDNSLWHKWQTTAGSSTWTGWVSLGGSSIANNPTITRNTDGRLEVFVVGGDTGLWHKWQTAAGSSTWTNWIPLSGTGVQGDAAITRNTDGRLEVFVVGNDDSLWHKWQSTQGSSTWSQWQSLGGDVASGSSPATGINNDGTLEVLVVSTDNQLYHKSQTSAGSNSWSGYETLGGAVKSESNPAAVRNSDGRLEVFVVGTDDGLYHKWQTSAGTGEGDVYDDFEGSGTYSLTDGQISPNGKWKSLYTGFGITKVTQDQLGNKYMNLEPMTSTSPGETHGSAVATTTSYKNFDLTLDVKTIRQLRQNSPPNSWETAWLIWNAIDQFHAYGFTLKTQGFQLEKKDNINKDDSAEIYLVTQNSPSVKLNTWQKWQIMVTGTETGTPRIQVWIDGAKIVDYIDNQPGIPRNSEIMRQGGPIVLYTEDAAVGFDNVKIKPL